MNVYFGTDSMRANSGYVNSNLENSIYADPSEAKWHLKCILFPCEE